MSDTDFDIGAFGLHELTDDFAELVGIRELSGSCRRWKGRFRARRRGHALHGIHVMETAAESGDLLRTLQKKKGGKKKKDERFNGKSDKILHKGKRQCPQK